MHFSPCGWFCFEEPENWTLVDRPDCMHLEAIADDAHIDITSARKNSKVDEHDVIHIHERWLGETGYIEQESTFETYSETVSSYRTIAGDAERIRILQHVFWSNYVACFEISMPINSELQDHINDYQDMIASLETLTID